MTSIIEVIWMSIGAFLQVIGVLRYGTEFTNVEYTNSNNERLTGYLALPPNYDSSSNQTYPLALIFHAWNGMDDEPTYFADLAAQEAGYIAFAPDLFRGISASSTSIAWNILTVSVISQDRMDQEINDALEYLDLNYNVDVSNVVSGPGFCFGGSQALELSKRRSTGATVSLYGSSISELQDPNDDEAWGLLGSDGTPILGIYGAEDMAPSVEDVNGFEAALMERNATYNVTIYDGVGHAFVNPEAHQSGDEQATKAWDQVVAFLLSLKEGSLGDASRLNVRREIQMRKTNPYRPSRKWIWDHLTDNMRHKGHANRHQG